MELTNLHPFAAALPIMVPFALVLVVGVLVDVWGSSRPKRTGRGA